MSYAADLKALRDRAGLAESYRFEQPSAGNSFGFRHVWLRKHTYQAFGVLQTSLAQKMHARFTQAP